MPTAVLALLGVAVGAFAFSGAPSGSQEPLPAHKPAPAATPVADVKRSAWAKQANTICANLNDETDAIPELQVAGNRDGEQDADDDDHDEELDERETALAPALRDPLLKPLHMSVFLLDVGTWLPARIGWEGSDP